MRQSSLKLKRRKNGYKNLVWPIYYMLQTDKTFRSYTTLDLFCSFPFLTEQQIKEKRERQAKEKLNQSLKVEYFKFILALDHAKLKYF